MNRVKTFFATLALLFVGSSLIWLSTPVSALESSAPAHQVAVCTGNNFFGFSSWDACLPRTSDGSPKITKLQDVWLVIIPLIEGLIKAAAYVGAAVMFFAIIRFITARGDMGKVKNAIETIRDAVIGLIICLLSIAIVQFVAGRFSQ
jgi:hypothetical protein